jgi:hypothetical protein
MWRFLTASSSRAAARRFPNRRFRRHQPDCATLEDRSLLSVSLIDITPTVPFVGSPVTWAASSRGLGKKAVYRWFSHQHDVHYVNGTTLLVFDDGNTRQATSRSAHSRGQEWIVNEQNMTATLLVNADMGNYSDFLGSSQMLGNGNLAFTSGNLSTSKPSGQSIQVLPDGTRIYVQQMSIFEYRSYFESSLYTANILD